MSRLEGALAPPCRDVSVRSILFENQRFSTFYFAIRKGSLCVVMIHVIPFRAMKKKNMRGGTEQNKAASFRTTKKLFSHVNSLRTTLLHNSENGFRTVAEAELGLLLPLHKRFLFICYAYVLLPCVCVCVEGLLFLFLPPILMHIWSRV